MSMCAREERVRACARADGAPCTHSRCSLRVPPHKAGGCILESRRCFALCLYHCGCWHFRVCFKA